MPAQYVTGLVCPQCNKVYPLTTGDGLVIKITCDNELRQLRTGYNLDLIAQNIGREIIQSRPEDMWRYLELLSIAGDQKPETSLGTGFTPLIRADNLAKVLGVEELYLKDDTVTPTGSFKDRGVDVAVARAKELGYEIMACVSTGNLAKSTAAYAKEAGMKALIFVPIDIEKEKIAEIAQYNPILIGINGDYDAVNKLGGKISSEHPEIAFVNIDFRPYYGDGSKTMGFEIVEQLGWRAPADIVVPIGGALLTTKIGQSLQEFSYVGLINKANTRIHGAQGEGSSPVVNAILNGEKFVTPVTPNTIASSIAIGNPSNGIDALNVIKGSGGYAATANDYEIVNGMQLLEEKEGILSEEVGGVVVASAKKLIEQGKIPRDKGPVVLLITGRRHEAPDVSSNSGLTDIIGPHIEEFNELYESLETKLK